MLLVIYEEKAGNILHLRYINLIFVLRHELFIFKMKCKMTLSEKVMLLKLISELSLGKHLEEQFSARMWGVIATFF